MIDPSSCQKKNRGAEPCSILNKVTPNIFFSHYYPFSDVVPIVTFIHTLSNYRCISGCPLSRLVSFACF